MSASAGAARGWRAERLRAFSGGAGSWLGYLAEELEARPGRLARTVRLALIAAVGNGIMAAAHVQTVLGPYLLWAVAAAPRAMMTPREALSLVAVQGSMLALSIPLAALLVEAPWLHVSFFPLFVASWSYVVRRNQLSNAWLLIGITVIDSFYFVIFDYRGFGWAAASVFGGAVIAFGTILIFDRWLWPDPADPALRGSVAGGLERTRHRLDLARRAYFDPRLREAIPSLPVISDLPGNLTLLDRVEREGASARYKSELLGIVTMNERLHHDVLRLLVLAREPLSAGHRLVMRAEIERAIDAIDTAITELERRVRSGSMLGAPLAATLVGPMAAALAALDAAAVDPSRAPAPAEAANLSSFVSGLHHMARMLEQRAEYPQLRAQAPAGLRSLYDPEMARWGLKLAVATVVMLVIALATHSDEMTAALWTVLIAGLPTLGATVRKMALRLAGVLVGGAIAIATLVVVTPNFQTVLTYMMICFVVFLGCGWAAQSSGRIAYAGSQMGTTFTLVFAGLSPSERLSEPLWRAWAVILGILVTTAVFVVLWPAYAGDTMLPRLRRLLGLNLELIPGPGQPLGDADIDAREIQMMDAITELLAVADDARLEGARSGVNADSVIDAAGSLRRIAHRLGGIATGRGRQHPLSAEAERARRGFEERLAGRLRTWLEYFEAGRPFDARRADAILAAHRRDDLERALDDWSARATAASHAEVAEWPVEARRSLLAEVESCHRVVVLAGELDQQLAAIPAREG